MIATRCFGCDVELDINLATAAAQGYGLYLPCQVQEIPVACLSIVRDGGPVTVAANPIFLLDPVDSRNEVEIRRNGENRQPPL